MFENIKQYVCNKYFVALLMSLGVCVAYYYYLKRNIESSMVGEGEDSVDVQKKQVVIDAEGFGKLFMGAFLCSLGLIFGLQKSNILDKYCPSFMSGGANQSHHQQQHHQQNSPHYQHHSTHHQQQFPKFSTELPDF